MGIFDQVSMFIMLIKQYVPTRPRDFLSYMTSMIRLHHILHYLLLYSLPLCVLLQRDVEKLPTMELKLTLIFALLFAGITAKKFKVRNIYFGSLQLPF